MLKMSFECTSSDGLLYMEAHTYLTKKDLEERWGVSDSMLYRMCKAGQLAKEGGRGQLSLFESAAIAQWEAEHPAEMARFYLLRQRKAETATRKSSRQSKR